MKVLVDHNIEGQSVLLWDVLAAEGWLELVLARLDERGYRERCSMRLLEIMLDIDQYRGAACFYTLTNSARPPPPVATMKQDLWAKITVFKTTAVFVAIAVYYLTGIV